MKKIFSENTNNEPLTKKLMNYITNDNKEIIKNSCYDTIDKGNVLKGLDNYREHSSRKNNKEDANVKIKTNSNSEKDLNTSDSLSKYFEKETDERINKLIRFGVDYCRASPNITLKNNKSLLNIGWRLQKFSYDVEYETQNYKGEKLSIHSIMTAIPINKSVINFDDDFIRESFSKILKFLTLNHKNILPYLHFDVLPSQKLMIKILNINENGSLRDTIYKANPLNSFNKKYPNSKVKGLHNSLISNYGRQILEALNYLHNNKWYHMHLHTGNVLIDNNNCIKLVELENFVNDIPIRNDHLFNYAYESFNSTYYTKNDYNSVILSEIFKNNSNIFEKIDIICFGRILYEMTTGRELKAPFPDPIEYKDIEADISEVLSIIFNKKTSKVNSNFIFTIPEVNASDLLKMKFFNPEDGSNNQESKNFYFIL